MAKLTKKAEKQIGEFLVSMTHDQLVAEVMERVSDDAAYDYPRTSGRWASDVLDAIGPVVALLDDGHGDVVIGICEYALGRIEKLMERVDDSSGWFAEIVAQLELTHLRACRAASPDPVKLARRLFVWDAESGWDIFAGWSIEPLGGGHFNLNDPHGGAQLLRPPLVGLALPTDAPTQPTQPALPDLR